MKKLKPNYSIVGLVPAIVSTLVLALISVVFGIDYGLKSLAVIIFIYAFLLGFWFYVKTGNRNFLVIFLYLLSLSLFIFFINVDMLNRNEGLQPISRFFMVMMYFFALWLFYLLFRKKFKWKGREVMELAAREVEEGDNSFTERPKPIDKISINRNELLELAKYLKENLIFHTYVEKDGILLIPVKEGREYSLLYSGPDLVNDTWIRIDFEGGVTVKVSQKDYLDYKYNLSFDQLTEALGHLVIDFAGLFKKGEEIRIHDRINMIHVGYFS